MFRGLALAAAAVGSAHTFTPAAAADQTSYAGDVPGITYDAHLTAPCYQWDKFIFGRGPDGQAMACHFIEAQSHVGLYRPPEGTGPALGTKIMPVSKTLPPRAAPSLAPRLTYITR